MLQSKPFTLWYAKIIGVVKISVRRKDLLLKIDISTSSSSSDIMEHCAISLNVWQFIFCLRIRYLKYTWYLQWCISLQVEWNQSELKSVPSDHYNYYRNPTVNVSKLTNIIKQMQVDRLLCLPGVVVDLTTNLWCRERRLRRKRRYKKFRCMKVYEIFWNKQWQLVHFLRPSIWKQMPTFCFISMSCIVCKSSCHVELNHRLALV